MAALVLEIREGTLDGDRTLTAFAAEHSVALTRFAYLVCGDRQRAEDLVQDALLALYRRFGATLPDRQRAVLVLRYYLDLTDRQIAETLDCREGTVRSLAARAFATLRELPEFSRGKS